ncbi:NAD(P)-dependent oxidoreductase [Corynebacterium provencense]|uniref:NAD(P)-dependent oxidoreductase n=1 Tax=Corynebacterium provencense TaxID=1737425 RepID=UPI00082C59C6|nr:NAD(P)H-binding protein [Corynebacterium provencense]MCI1255854.1 NAD(P)H-binding protein [Corynebacterium provencense]
MSRILVFGAAGTAGSRITAEALNRGHEVVAAVRHPDSATVDSRAEVVKGDALDADSVRELAADVDAVVIAIGTMTSSPWADAARTVTETVAGLDNDPYIVHMGGGASLLGPDGRRIVDSEGFPEAFMLPARGQTEALDWYLANATGLGVRWTFVSPPPVDFKPGERTGSYRTSLDTPVVDDGGASRISYEDFAVALVDEIESPKFVGRRFTVGY